ncbi:carbohydrate ABC transporter substrate-binding protein [Photobacterium gaetbulicola]|uniref:Solute-binding periplasmic protein of ABC transporter n=1 Tax=Photobacterium gaetbulicola Gung47 TaxID=658445 RepID=A0A0C5X2A4_9GAMM|nr:ABC transporter substrate-binding protein [Photobacterium gaetbulicola]AJR09475.1 solute-binding periplasmic protein of ABC transporter [Photobacterium gaetbulicola Gung47]PSU14270.1 carbohydrate ABC transporter substrate-binding protein [Photobacterium gaetbulicola]
MKAKTLSSWVLGGVAAAILTGCGGDTSDPQSIKMWIAPNETQEAFWSEVVTEWNASGQGLPVEFTTIPATGSSEEAIMNALAAGTEPDITENIFSGFAAQLNELDQLVDLSKFDGYQDLISGRNMSEIMNGWQLDGKQLVFPLYMSPVVYWWRSDILEEYGFTDVPRTYDDVYKLAKAYSVKNKRYPMQVAAGRNWWDRWFDFITMYYAASDGKNYLNAKNQLDIDEEAAKDVLTFIDTMFTNGWASYDFGESAPLVTGEVVGAVRGPWDIGRFQTQYPDVIKNIKIGPMLTKDGRDNPNTLADGKGMVMFKSSDVKEEAWEFINWVYNNEKFDKRWLELTGMPPARGDLMELDIFKEYFKANPLAAGYAEQVSLSQPTAFTSKTVEVQRAMTNMIEKIIFNKTDVEGGLSGLEKEVNSIRQ